MIEDFSTLFDVRSEQRYFNFRVRRELVNCCGSLLSDVDYGKLEGGICLAFCVELQCHPISIFDPISAPCYLHCRAVTPMVAA
jgi:hypothetical protein